MKSSENSHYLVIFLPKLTLASVQLIYTALGPSRFPVSNPPPSISASCTWEAPFWHAGFRGPSSKSGHPNIQRARLWEVSGRRPELPFFVGRQRGKKNHFRAIFCVLLPLLLSPPMFLFACCVLLIKKIENLIFQGKIVFSFLFYCLPGRFLI